MNHDTSSFRATPAASTGRATHLVLLAVIACAIIGLVVGIDDGVPRPALKAPGMAGAESDETVIPALSYAELRDLDIGPNRHWVSHVGTLTSSGSDRSSVPEPNETDKLASLRLRSERRAYNGAPPVVPHRVDQLSDASCLTCHETGRTVGSRAADRLPHPYLTNCQQCHVAASDVFEPTVLAPSSWAGLPTPTAGARAWPGAPPQIPHSTFMRDNCLSCHGPQGKPGLQTTHPERQNCLQCHAPSAVLDHGITVPKSPLLPPPIIDHP